MATGKTRVALMAMGMFVTLTGMVRAGDIDLIQLPGTVHTYGGGYSPEHAYDGDFSTDHYDSFSDGDGGYGRTIWNAHEFPVESVINTIVFRMRAHSFAHGNYQVDHNGFYVIEYKAGADWTDVPGSRNSYSGGDGDTTIDPGEVTLPDLNLVDVTDVRATVNAFGNASGGEGVVGGDVHIFEIQAFGVPEPSTLGLLAMSSVGLTCFRRRNRRLLL